MVNFGANGFGFRFNVARTWAKVEVFFNIAVITNLTNVLFYFEPNCFYNDANLFFVNFDNMQLTGIETNYVAVGNILPADEQIQISPTLFHDHILVSSASTTDMPASVKMLDPVGREVFQTRVNLHSGPQSLSIPTLPCGIYYLTITTAGRQTCSRLVRY